MATITITISDIEYPFQDGDAVEGEFHEALTNIAGHIESAIDNAFGNESAAMYGSVDVSIDEED